VAVNTGAGSQSVAVIATVLNEGAELASWLSGLERQTLPPDEVIIVDGGSRDDTLRQLRAWSPPFEVHIVCAHCVSISAGRNLAISAATSDIVAVTDAGTVAAADWLEHLVEPFVDPEIDVVAGGFLPVLETRWQRALAAATLPDLSEISGASFLPSSRSVAVRRRWLDVGYLYPAWLDYCEDLIWDLQLRRGGAAFYFTPGAVVKFAPRPNLASYARQYFRYARGDGKAGLWRRRHLARYGAYASALFAMRRRRPAELVIVAVLGIAYATPVVRRLRLRDSKAGIGLRSTVPIAVLAVLLRTVGDIAKMAGYPVGLTWRVHHFGPRTSWQRITPDGRRWRPGSRQTGNRLPTASRVAVSHREQL
jgi:cellulose synthase/poly-beta-1,6-N-acetylglucosamine synthase-like glycosyltransferase